MIFAGEQAMEQHKEIITNNPGMRAILERIESIAVSDFAVLLVGETGVGKELFADAIHQASKRQGKQFLKIGLNAVPRELFESELFGHEKGAFTGAWTVKKGLFEICSDGSIFLDDIDDCPMELQPKLLRVLESHEVLRIGSTKPISVNTRIIAATKVNLKALVDQGSYRSDFYYRISEIPIEIPPLRNRPDDIPLLARQFLRRFAPDRELAFSDQALAALLAYPWPGNVRELRSVARRLTLFAGPMIQEHDLPVEVRLSVPAQEIARKCTACLTTEQMSFESVVSCLEINLLRHALKKAQGNYALAARLLSIKPSTFRDKVNKYRAELQSILVQPSTTINCVEAEPTQDRSLKSRPKIGTDLDS
jgi:transcriptional regulator with GAF, ATPase, and Fis domain